MLRKTTSIGPRSTSWLGARCNLIIFQLLLLHVYNKDVYGRGFASTYGDRCIELFCLLVSFRGCFLAMLVAIHFNPVSKWASQWVEL